MKLFTFTRRELTKMGIVTALVFVALVTNVAFSAWNEPTAAPTGGNTPAPLNVGSDWQVRTGPMRIQSTLHTKYIVADPVNGEGGEIRLDNVNSGSAMYLDNNQGRFRVFSEASKEAIIANQDGTVIMPYGLRAHNIAIGRCPFGACPYPYETLQLPWQQNFRFQSGGTEVAAITWEGNILAPNIVRGSQVRANSYCDFNGGNCFSAAEVVKKKVDYIRQGEHWAVSNGLKQISRISCNPGDTPIAARSVMELEWFTPETVLAARASINGVPWNHAWLMSSAKDVGSGRLYMAHANDINFKRGGTGSPTWTPGYYNLGFTYMPTVHYRDFACNGPDGGADECGFVGQLLCRPK